MLRGLVVVSVVAVGAIASCARSDDIDGSGGGASGDVGGAATVTKGASATVTQNVSVVNATFASSASSAQGQTACGDSTIDSGEECDDGNADDGDGCTSCVVDCAAGEDKDPNTNHCYRVVTSGAAWIGAQADCVAWGGAPGLGNLAVVTDAAESSFIGGIIGVKSWIGGTDAAAEGSWTWIDAEAWAFTNWEPGEPNNGNNEDCAIMKVGGMWDDHPCDDAYAYVCERGAAGE